MFVRCCSIEQSAAQDLSLIFTIDDSLVVITDETGKSVYGAAIG